MKTLYVQIPTILALPKEAGRYFTSLPMEGPDGSYFNPNDSINVDWWKTQVTFWLKPISLSRLFDNNWIDTLYPVGGLTYPSSLEFPHPNEFKREAAKEMYDWLITEINNHE